MCDEKTKILACAPSNSAADIIAQRLSVLGPSQLFRLNSYTREFKHLPVDLQRFSKYNKDQVFEMPELETLRGFRVVVSTCITAGVAYGLGLPRGHFTNIFVDEAGQATEPEAVIAINSLAGPMTNLVLAGDPQQLGPVLHSPVSQALGLRTSLLSRIMARDLYDLDEQRGLK
jgi:helicase MOV-10